MADNNVQLAPSGATLHPSAARDHTDAIIRMLDELSVLHSTIFASTAAAADAYLDFVMRVLDVRSAFIANLDADYLHIINARDNNGCGIPTGGLIPTEESFCQYVRATGQPVIVTDAAQDVRVMDVATRTQFTIGSYLGVPLLFSDGIVYGTLCALDPQPRTFTPLQVAIVRIVARHMALLIEHTVPNADDPLLPPITGLLGTIDPQTLLLQTVLHDLRNPLAGVQGYIELFLRDFLGPLSEDQRAVLTRMAHSTQFLNRLINDLVDAAASETGTLTLLTQPFDACLIAQTVLESFHTQAQTCGLGLHIECAMDLPTMTGDPDRLRQVLENLVGNAVRHTTHGSVTVQITYEGMMVQFAVADTGPGLAVDIQQTIWQRHSRSEQTTSGMGLSLYIVQQLVLAMQGTLGVESTLGEGSTFWIRVPIQGDRPRKIVLL